MSKRGRQYPDLGARLLAATDKSPGFGPGGDCWRFTGHLTHHGYGQIGRGKADGVTAWLVPGSWAVRRRIEEEGLDRILAEAGFEIRQPGCSACLAMNADKIPAGKYAVSTSNRNFEGRQGPGARTMLSSPLTAAAAAVTGCITDPRELL